MSKKEGVDKAPSEPLGGHKFSGVRRMIEDIAVTPFFERHSSHMPATLKLHAEVEERDGWVVLKTEVPGFSEELVEVSANENSIHIRLHSGEAEKSSSSHKTHESDVLLHSSYVTPSLINPAKLKVSHRGDVLEVRVPVLFLPRTK
jgi:HSP20 family molecular chaperone IbpA